MTDGVADRWAGWAPHYRRSLASRVALLTTAALGLALALVSIGGFAMVRQQMETSFDNSLIERAHAAARTPTLSQITADYAVPSWALGAADVRIFFINGQGAVRSADEGPDLPIDQPEFAVARGEATESIRTLTAETGVRFRVAAVPTTGGQGLVIAQSLGPQDRTLRSLSSALLLLAGVGIIVSALSGWAVARNGLRPVRRLTAAVERAARTEELAPLTIEGDDEVGRLGKAFNQLLAAVQASRARQRQLVADAGHELRTPLTSLRTNLDLLAQVDGEGGGLPSEARAELLDDVRAQIEEMSTLVGDLVELARDEPLASAVELVDLAEIAERALVRVRRRAPDLTFASDLRSWWLMGESGPLERAVTNLLDNAAKWSAAGGTVRLRLAGGVLTVDDEGPGIPPDDLPHVFDRFYRASESRGMPGSGLGLSIVRQVTERHLGVVQATASPSGGARLSITLPGRAIPPA